MVDLKHFNMEEYTEYLQYGQNMVGYMLWNIYIFLFNEVLK